MHPKPTKYRVFLIFTAFTALLLQGCAGYLPSAGASRSQVEAVAPLAPDNSPVKIIPVTNAIANQVKNSQNSLSFRSKIAPKGQPANLIHSGDTLQVLIWEAYPPILFRQSSYSNTISTAPASVTISPTVSQASGIPAQTVNQQGEITIPFIGRINVAGKNISQIENTIVKNLQGRANDPQVIVQNVGNTSSLATIIGEVNQSMQMPLTPKGERILDAVASAGGLKNPVNKTTIQIARQGEIQSLAMEAIIQDPKQNIVLQPGDVITAYFQPLSFTALGATGQANNEIMFEATGITLSQAMGRIGGLNDMRSDSMGVYIFRFEDPKTVVTRESPTVGVNAEGKVPVIYQFDMNKPETYFAAQNFPMKNKDVVYVSTASSVELMKFLSIITSVFSPAVAINNQFSLGF
jgi:polysaccharide export outer membrane protein